MILYDKEKMNDPSVVGGKGLGLAKLVQYGCCVPDFFVIAAGTVLDDTFAAELECFAAKLHCDTFSVRSSNLNEDTAANSFAGQYLTRLNVPRDQLFQAALEVAGSAHTKRAKQYAARFQTKPSEMAIIVQRQITGKRSGVLFTRTPSSGAEILIESVEGAGEALVSGAATPHQSIFPKSGFSVGEPYETELIEEALRLEQLEGYPLDLEWTYSDRLYFLQLRPITVLGDALPEIPKRNWNFYVYRDFCLLAHSVQRRASEREVQKRLFGFCVPIQEGLLINGREFYSDENDAATNQIWKDHDQGDFFEAFIKAIKALVQRTKRRANALKRQSYADADTKHLFDAYRSAIEAYIDSYVPLMMRPDDYLLEALRAQTGELSAQTVDILTPVWRQSYYSEEQKDFFMARICGDVNSYLDKYEWMLNPLGKVIRHVTAEDVQKRFQRLTVAQAQQALEQTVKNRLQKKRRFVAYLAEKQNQQALHRLLRLLSQFIYLRTYTAENSDRLFYYIREKLLFEIAVRLQIPREEILCMTYQEISDLKHGLRAEKSAIAKRKSGEVITFFGGENQAYYGAGANALLTELLPIENNEIAILTGSVACSGEIRGRVKIVSDFTQTDKVEEGDIVVTSMTTPEIISALEKAGGIITDEGGITCHAAILAREYGVPCLVGTKTATRVLSDGMHVYLDCIGGRVEILPDEEKPLQH